MKLKAEKVLINIWDEHQQLNQPIVFEAERIFYPTQNVYGIDVNDFAVFIADKFGLDQDEVFDKLLK